MASRLIAARTKRVPVTAAFITGVLGLVSTASAQSDVLIEACNSLKSSTKKLECLKSAKAARAQDKKESLPPATAKPGDPPPFTLDTAAASCEAFAPGLAKRRAEATEDVSGSSAEVMTVTWRGVDSKPPISCVVDRQTRKIVSVTVNGKTIKGAMLDQVMADRERFEKQSREFAAGNYSNFVQRAKTSLTENFKDPGSAQYRSLFISGDNMPVLCGEVNAKNSYGAYVGFRRFYATGEPLLNAVEPAPKGAGGDGYAFDKMWPSMCGQRKADIES